MNFPPYFLSEIAKQVAIVWGPKEYDAVPPYSPGNDWPEYQKYFGVKGERPNEIYNMVRESLRLLGFDADAYGTANWNPLGKYIQPGNTVVLKPNFVREFRDTHTGDGLCTITHGAVIRAVLDFAYIALQGKGRLIVADAPHNDADFDAIKFITHLDAITKYYRETVGFAIEIYDLRPEKATKIQGVIVRHVPLKGDPDGYVKIDLGRLSAFDEINHLCDRLFGSEYDRGELVSHHTGGRHEYLLSKTILQADCVISLPKLKTHKKVGLTINMKNLVGINGNKNWLPHHREGVPAEGGDQFRDNYLKRRIEQRTMEIFRKYFPYLGGLRESVAGPIKDIGKKIFGDTNTGTIRSGNWYGNDTTWRTAIDLNRILFYSDSGGKLHDRPQRHFFSVVDGIVAGHKNGPLDAEPKPAGVILAGSNPVAVDLSCARIMGFDYRRIPMLARSLDRHPLPIASFSYEDLAVRSNEERFCGKLASFRGPILGFAPHFGWQGHIELQEEST